MLSGFFAWIGCLINNLYLQVVWIAESLAALIPQILEFVTYVISLKWLTDFIAAFFEKLDSWVSELFGVDPDLPFFDQVMQGVVDWLLAPFNDAAKRRIEEKKW